VRLSWSISFLVSVLSISAAAQSKPGSDTTEVIGTWEGESQCAVPDSPCHEEHVIYEITLDKDKSAPAPLKMDGYKLVNGERIFMGTLRCNYDSAKRNLSCTSGGKNFDDWQYTLSGLTLQGALTTGEGKILYRKITVQKRSPH
jgi:hypothetical protein